MGGSSNAATSSSGASSSSSGAGGAPAACANVFQGDFTIHNALDAMTISPYCEITGTLQLDAPGLTSVSLPNLQTVGGQLEVYLGNGTDESDLLSLSLPALTSAGGVDVEASQLNSLELPNLTTVTTFGLQVVSAALPSLSLPKLVSVTSPGLGIGVGISAASMSSIDLSALVSAPDEVSLTLGGGASVSLPALTSCSILIVWTNGSLSVPLLSQTSSVQLTACSSADLPALTTVGQDLTLNYVGSIDLGMLATVGGGLSLSANTGSFEFSLLSAVGAAITVEWDGSALPVDLSFPVLTSAGSLFITTFGSLSAPELATVTKGVTFARLSQFVIPVLTSIGGNLELSDDSLFAAPALQSIGGNLSLGGVGGFMFPALMSIGFDLYLFGVSGFAAPTLQTIGSQSAGGHVLVSATTLTSLDFPALTTIGSYLDLDPSHACAASSGNALLTQLNFPLLANLGSANSGKILVGNNPQLPQCRIDALAMQLTQHGWTGAVEPADQEVVPPGNPALCVTASGPCP
jgi:hypothetical protein